MLPLVPEASNTQWGQVQESSGLPEAIQLDVPVSVHVVAVSWEF